MSEAAENRIHLLPVALHWSKEGNDVISPRRESGRDQESEHNMINTKKKKKSPNLFLQREHQAAASYNSLFANFFDLNISSVEKAAEKQPESFFYIIKNQNKTGLASISKLSQKSDQ